jgi:hypothetical protein
MIYYVECGVEFTLAHTRAVISNEFPKARQITDEELKYVELQNLINKLALTTHNLYLYTL